MGRAKFTDAIRRAAAREVLLGAKPGEVAERYGTSLTTIWNWVHSYEDSEEAWRLARVHEEREEAERAKREETARRIARTRSQAVALVEIETDGGPMLAAVNVGRDGKETGTVQRIAGARVGDGEKISGRVVKVWFADPVTMRSVAEARLLGRAT